MHVCQVDLAMWLCNSYTLREELYTGYFRLLIARCVVIYVADLHNILSHYMDLQGGQSLYSRESNYQSLKLFECRKNPRSDGDFDPWTTCSLAMHPREPRNWDLESDLPNHV